MEIKTIELEKCIHIIGYYLNDDEKVIDELLNNKTNIFEDYCKPFYTELNLNLLNKDSFEAKRDMIKWYVFEFFELQHFWEMHSEILFNGSYRNYSPNEYEHEDKTGKKRKLDEFGNYVVNSWILFDMFFNEIQICCLKFNFDIHKICDELNFSTDYFDDEVTLGFRGLKKQVIARQTTNKKAELETLSSLITHESSKDIVVKIKIKYKNIKGKRLKLLLMAFQDLKLLPIERIAAKFYRCCKNEFDWGINSYTAMNDYIYNSHADEKELSDMKIYIETLTKNN